MVGIQPFKKRCVMQILPNLRPFAGSETSKGSHETLGCLVCKPCTDFQDVVPVFKNQMKHSIILLWCLSKYKRENLFHLTSNWICKITKKGLKTKKCYDQLSRLFYYVVFIDKPCGFFKNKVTFLQKVLKMKRYSKGCCNWWRISETQNCRDISYHQLKYKICISSTAECYCQ